MESELKTVPALHGQVAEILQQEIKRNVFAGGMLPSVRLLAQRFGVSSMTISGALKTLEKRGLVERVGGKGVFLRDRKGRSGKLGKRALSVGVLAYSAREELPRESYYGEVWTGLLNACAAHSCRVTFTPMQEGQEVAAFRRALAETQFDGAILVGLTDREALKRIARAGVPVVLADHHYDDLAMDCVTMDSEAGSRAAVRHLLELGHREVGALTWLRVENNPERWEGYRGALEAAGLDAAQQFVRAAAHDHAGGYLAIRAALAAGQRLPTALYCWDGCLAVGALQALREAGRQAPQDISVVTCANRGFMQFFPEMTVALADGAVLGRTAVEVLTRRIEDPARDFAKTTLPMPLEVRTSTARPKPA